MSVRGIQIADHYPDDLPVDIVIGATSRHAQYTVADLRSWAALQVRIAELELRLAMRGAGEIP